MRRFSAILATAVVIGGASVVSAHADTAPGGATIYVDRATGSNCSDTDPAAGSQAVPYCTLQTAVDAAQPGQTVQVAAGRYVGVKLTHSGTADQPIVLRGARALDPSGPATLLYMPSSENRPTVDIDGASYVSLAGLSLTGGTAAGPVLRVHAADHIDVDRSWVFQSNYGSAAEIDGATSTTLARTEVSGGAVVVHGGAQDTRMLVDSLYAVNKQQAAAVVVDGAVGTLVRNATVSDSQTLGLLVDGASKATRVDDSVFSGSQGSAELSVAADSVGETTVDHNVFQARSSGTPYQWAGTPYASQADFARATGQGVADCAASCGLDPSGRLTEGSAAIDSEDPAVTGLPDTDVNGRARVADPIVDRAGATGVTDRGAYEFTDPLHVSLAWVSDDGTPYAPSPGTFTATLANPWNDPATPTQYTFAFGDGSQPVATADPTVSHTYQAGWFNPQVTVETAEGRTLAASSVVQVQTPVDLGTSISASHTGGGADPLSTYLDVTDGGTWPVTGRTVNWGDGSAVQELGTLANATHRYPGPGNWTITETSTDTRGRVATATTRFVSGSAFVAHSPTRLLDTRTTLGGHKGALGPGGVLALKVTGVSGVPTSGVTAVVLNLTAADPAAAGYLTAYPSTGAVPTASSLNFQAHENRSNLVTVPVGPDGRIRVFAHVRTDVVADLAGYYRAVPQVSGGALYESWSPRRLLDTRAGKDVPLASGQTVKVQVRSLTGACTTAAVLNVTAVSPSAAGYVTAYGSGSLPSASSVNFSAGRTTAGLVIVPVAADGTVSLYNHGGKVHLLADLQGSFCSNGGNVFTPAGPTRLLDTRTGTGTPLARTGTATITSGIPAEAKSVLLNVTDTAPQTGGYLTAYAADNGFPSVSTLNFAPAETASNLAVVDVPSGAVTIADRSGGTVHAVVDLQGWFG